MRQCASVLTFRKLNVDVPAVAKAEFKLRDLSWFSLPVAVPPLGATVSTSARLSTIPKGISLHRLVSPITKDDYYAAETNGDEAFVVVKKSENT